MSKHRNKLKGSFSVRNLALYALTTATIALTGCATNNHHRRYNQPTPLKDMGSGALKVLDSAARAVRGKSSIPEINDNEIYTGQGVKGRVGYTLGLPVVILDQAREGLGEMVHAGYDLTVGQATSRMGEAGEVIDHGINPGRTDGLVVPTLQRGINYVEARVANVESNDPADRALERRMRTTEAKIGGSFPAFHELLKPDEGYNLPDFINEILWFTPSIFLDGGSSSPGGRGKGWGGGDGSGGPGGD